MNYKLIDNRDDSQYEFHIDGVVAKVEYIREDSILKLTHTKVPDQLRGRGIAASLVEKILVDIKNRGLYVTPQCSYIVTYIKRHPQWTDLIYRE